MIVKLKNKAINNVVKFSAQEIQGVEIKKVSTISELCKKPINELSNLEKAILKM